MAYCENCQSAYHTSAADHREVCQAYVCIVCEQTFEYVLEANSYGDRVCEGCRELGDEAELAYSGDEDIENEGSD